MPRTCLVPGGAARLGLLLGLAGGLAFAAAVPAAAAPEPKIVGGAATTISEWPWQAALVGDPAQGGNDFDRQFCGGSVIAPTIILTAAHCVTDPVLSPDQVQVVVGRTTLSSSQGQRLPVDTIVVDPSYDSTTLENDVAVLRVSGSTAQSPISLAGPGETSLWTAGSDAWVTGWGSDGSTSQDTLREARVPIISDSSCGSGSVYGSEFFPAVMVCAGFLAGGVDSCSGDSGGPLAVPAPGGSWRQVGVVSWGIGCAEPNHPGVYSRVGSDPLRAYVTGGRRGAHPDPEPGGTGARLAGKQHLRTLQRQIGGHAIPMPMQTQVESPHAQKVHRPPQEAHRRTTRHPGERVMPVRGSAVSDPE